MPAVWRGGAAMTLFEYLLLGLMAATNLMLVLALVAEWWER